jgi:hypothetical protein
VSASWSRCDQAGPIEAARSSPERLKSGYI